MIRRLPRYFQTNIVEIAIFFGCGGTPDKSDLVYDQEPPTHVPSREWILADDCREYFFLGHKAAMKTILYPRGSPMEGQTITLQLSSSERLLGGIEKTTIMNDIVYVVTLFIE